MFTRVAGMQVVVVVKKMMMRVTIGGRVRTSWLSWRRGDGKTFA
jgi:hypothetical protein